MTDWFKILSDLDHAGVNNSEVARRMGRSASTVYRWKMNEAEPSYSDGVRLMEIHAYVTSSANGNPLVPQS